MPEAVDTSRESPAAAPLRAEVLTWLDTSWDDSISLREWWERLADSGYGFPTWPASIGGLGLGRAAAQAIAGALGERGVIAPPQGIGSEMAVPTILRHGTAEQAAHTARSVATGAVQFCQLFSEPGAGSDLPSLGCRAIRDGEEFVVTGQKVWSSGAHLADLGLLLARTDVDAPRRHGITYMVVDMAQPGVTVRPLVQMNGRAEFCEVFLDEVRVPVGNVIGAIDSGWDVARTTLAAERAMAAAGRHREMPVVAAGRRAGNLDRTCSELLAAWAEAGGAARRGRAMLLGARTIRDLAARAGVTGAASMGDPRRAAQRDEVVDYHCRSEVHRLTQRRVAGNARAGRAGPESSIGKLSLADLAHRSRDLSFRLLGAEATLIDPATYGGGELQTIGLAAHGPSIGGGTNEIQRTTIAERVLGLPREPDAADAG